MKKVGLPTAPVSEWNRLQRRRAPLRGPRPPTARGRLGPLRPGHTASGLPIGRVRDTFGFGARWVGVSAFGGVCV